MSVALGESAVHLAWLAPSVAPLVALTRPNRPAAWQTVRCDPGAVLLLLRHSPPDRPPEPFHPTRFAPAALRMAHDLLAQVDAYRQLSSNLAHDGA